MAGGKSHIMRPTTFLNSAWKMGQNGIWHHCLIIFVLLYNKILKYSNGNKSHDQTSMIFELGLKNWYR